MGKENMRTKIRDSILEKVAGFLEKEYDSDVLSVGSGEISMPSIDDDGNEIFVNVKISIPRGTRKDGGYTPYDGYAVAEDYKAEKEATLAKKEKGAQKKQAKEEAKQLRKAISNLEKAIGTTSGE